MTPGRVRTLVDGRVARLIEEQHAGVIASLQRLDLRCVELKVPPTATLPSGEAVSITNVMIKPELGARGLVFAGSGGLGMETCKDLFTLARPLVPDDDDDFWKVRRVCL
jgi:hypothetical protein